MNKKNYFYRQIHPWRFMIELYDGDEFLGSFTDWNSAWPQVCEGLHDAGYVYYRRWPVLVPEKNYYEYQYDKIFL